MEFLRFGGRIAGNCWGCCAIDIIQSFDSDPDKPHSIQLVHGDTGMALTNEGGDALYAGPTYRDVFNTRLRIGTFGSHDQPNHLFLAAMTDGQLDSRNGAKWLAILKEHGFRFLGTTDNSVYSGPHPDKSAKSSHMVHLFGLFRNIGNAAVPDPFQPPQAWLDLPMPTKSQREIWDETGPTKLMTERKLKEMGATNVYYAGQQGKLPEWNKLGNVTKVEDGYCDFDEEFESDEEDDDYDPFDVEPSYDVFEEL